MGSVPRKAILRNRDTVHWWD